MADGVLTRGAIQGVLRSFRVWAMYTHMAGVASAKEVDHDVALRAAVTHTRKAMSRAAAKPGSLADTSTMADTVARHEEQLASLARQHQSELESSTRALEVDKDHEHSTKLAPRSERDEAHGKERQALESSLKDRHKNELSSRDAAHTDAVNEINDRHKSDLTYLKENHDAELSAAVESASLEKDRHMRSALTAQSQEHDAALAQAIAEREAELRALHDQELASRRCPRAKRPSRPPRLTRDRSHKSAHAAELKAKADAHAAALSAREDELLAGHKSALQSRADQHATEIDEAQKSHQQQQDMLRSRHEAELASATEMLALEKDSAHNSRLVSELRARDDEHAKTMEAREKELAEKHAALLAELRSSLTAAHDAAMAETLGQHEEQRATQQRRHETDLESRGSPGSREGPAAHHCACHGSA
ncbi:hypothetical protein JL722_3074 [Aureococcus anophagefferens]|nr:hypothetical protein JL722_3074 [Aureococcus anophagefferens]